VTSSSDRVRPCSSFATPAGRRSARSNAAATAATPCITVHAEGQRLWVFGEQSLADSGELIVDSLRTVVLGPGFTTLM
jgi:hypothetical protein